MPSSQPLPSEPFRSWPVQLFDPRFGFAWYCGRGIVVVQTTIHCATGVSANAYHDYEATVLREHDDEIRAAGGLLAIHDWRRTTDHDADARRVWQARMWQNRRGYLRGSVVCLANASAILRISVGAINVFTSVTFGAPVRLVTDLHEVLAQEHLLDSPPEASHRRG